MNILFLTPRNSEKNLGGVEGHVRLLTEELKRRGDKVKELALDESIKVTPCSARSHLFKLRAWGYLWRERDLFKWADVIHVHDVFWWWLPFGLLNLLGVWGDEGNRGLFKGSWRNLEDFRGMKRGRPAFITFHGWEGVCPPSRSAVWQKKLAAFLSNGTIGVGSFFEKWYGVTPNKVVFGVLDPNISIASLDSSTALGMTKNSLDCHVPLSGTRNDKPSIVFLGRMEKVNGVEVLLEALDKLINRQIDKYSNRQIDKLRWYSPQVIFVGEGRYRKQAEKFGKVTGMIKDPQKYLVDADIVITSSYMSMLEAAAMGKPVIAIGNSELKEDYLKTHPLRKWIRICRNPEGLIREIREIRGELDLAKRWAVGQTPERLADVYEGLWNLR